MPKIVIEPPVQGVAQSAHVGFEALRNLDIDSIAGIAQLNKIMVNETASDGLIKWIVRNPLNLLELFAATGANNKIYRSDDAGNSWVEMVGVPTSGNNANGLKIWKDYLILATNTNLATHGPLSGVTFTVTIASPGVVTATAHGLVDNDRVELFTTQADLPTGLTIGVSYHVVNSDLANTFQLSLTQGGAAINTSGSQSGTHSFKAWKGDNNAFQTIDNDTDWHPMFISKLQDTLYGGAGKYIPGS